MRFRTVLFSDIHGAMNRRWTRVSVNEPHAILHAIYCGSYLHEPQKIEFLAYIYIHFSPSLVEKYGRANANGDEAMTKHHLLQNNDNHRTQD